LARSALETDRFGQKVGLTQTELGGAISEREQAWPHGGAGFVEALAQQIVLGLGERQRPLFGSIASELRESVAAAGSRSREGGQPAGDVQTLADDPGGEDEGVIGLLAPGGGWIEDRVSVGLEVLLESAVADSQPAVGLHLAGILIGGDFEEARLVAELGEGHLDQGRGGAAGGIEGDGLELLDGLAQEELHAGDARVSGNGQSIEVAIARLPKQLDAADQRDVQLSGAQLPNEDGRYLAHELDALLLIEAQVERPGDEERHAADAQCAGLVCRGVTHGRRVYQPRRKLLLRTKLVRSSLSPHAKLAPMEPPIFEMPDFPGYALLDSGNGEKLERFGTVVLRRPDPQALWRPQREDKEWASAHLSFIRESDRGGRWQAHRDAPREARGKEPSWTVPFGNARFVIRPTPFKHVGLFPEQAANWMFLQERGEAMGSGAGLLNLFGYSGAASVLAAQAGFEVTHVDASRASLNWTSENAVASGLGERALRIVHEDALAFAQREARRGKKYAGILLDPPHYGRGPKGEKWQFEELFASLLEAVAELLDERSFLVLSTYAIGYSPLAFHNLLSELEGGEVAAGELALREEPGDRLLPCGFCARWWRGA